MQYNIANIVIFYRHLNSSRWKLVLKKLREVRFLNFGK